MTQRILLLAGIAAPALYIVTDIVASLYWREYSVFSQTVSELIAIDAPTRPFVVPAFVIYAFLVYAFGVGVWQSSGPRRALRLSGLFLITKEILGVIVTLYFPIHLRGVKGNFSDVMHGILTGLGVLCILLAIGFAAKALEKQFRWYSIATIVLLFVCGSLAGMQGQQLVANQPTPWMGVFERVNIYGFMLWNIALAIVLIRRGTQSSISQRSHGAG
jgi:hypothetical protein